MRQLLIRRSCAFASALRSGAIFLWQKQYPMRVQRFDPSGDELVQDWHLLKPLPDSQTIKYLKVLWLGSNDDEPLIAVKSRTDKTFSWQGGDWHSFEKFTRLGQEWPLEWPSENETAPQLLLQTNQAFNASAVFPLAARVNHGGFHPWFQAPRPPGKVVDEINLSAEGALSDWVSCYALLDDGRLFVLATERDLVDVVVELAGGAVALVAGIVWLIILRQRRKHVKLASMAAASC